MLESLFTFWNVLLMVLGFGFIVFVHEAGHFLAARWAGIRVHAFAIGFGQAVFSYRKGWGMRKGSSELEYMRLVSTVKNADKPGASAEEIEAGHAAAEKLNGISPTEYRLNWIPFGGYVKMLGQEDLNPEATSAEPDSYQNKPVWKRMVVISAGVIMNVILAAVLFIVVFKAGMTEPAPVIGAVMPDSPAARAGLEPGDIVRSANGTDTVTFTDLFIEIAMTKTGSAVDLVVDRPVEGGGFERVECSPVPERLELAPGMPSIGIAPETSLEIIPPSKRASVNAGNRSGFESLGLGDVPFGSRVTAINGEPVVRRSLEREGLPGTGDYANTKQLTSVIDASAGQPVTVEFESPEGETVRSTLIPVPELMRDPVAVDTDKDGDPVVWNQAHLFGMAPVMRVQSSNKVAQDQNLLAGDLFKRIGSVAWPSRTEGVRAIKSNTGGTIDAVVIRDGQEIPLSLRVSIEGTVGFTPEDDLSVARLASVPALLEPVKSEEGKIESFRLLQTPPAAGRLGSLESIRAGAIVTAIAGQPVSDFTSMRAALKSATESAIGSESGASVEVELSTPFGTGEAVTESVTLELLPEEIAALHDLGWQVPDIELVFEMVDVFVQADSVGHAVGMGVSRTKRVLKQTYLTFQRLFEGSVEVKQLQGPVGITHTGSMFAEKGIIYLLYFMALISANLAVINFLPLPIVDGGQFLMLCYEGLAKRPVPIIVQNVITLGGLLFIGALFLYITFNDILRLLSI
ncbi:MAG: site-2 protease family protein [Phycisphaerales bacterium JB050]